MFKRVKKSDWILLGLYVLIALTMVFYEEWSEEDIPFFGIGTLKLFGILLLDYLFDMLVAIIVVFWIFYDYFRQRKYVTSMVLIVIVLSVQRIIQSFILPWMYNWVFDDFIHRMIEGIQTNFESVSGICLLLIGKAYYESKNRILELEKEKKAGELQLLKAQIDPHFLFNNLNILDILIEQDPQKAREYTKRLSSLYRYLIRHKDKDVVNLQEEWVFSEDYIFLLQQRFDDLYQFEVDLNPAVLETYFIPPAAMQTLLENIVKHNIALPDQPILTKIHIANDCLLVENDYRPKEMVKDSTGIGLMNLKKRILLLTDKQLLVEQKGNRFTVQIPLVKLSA